MERTAMADKASLLHQVARHEWFDAKLTRVVFHCVGWVSEGFQPDEDTHYVSYLVPVEEVKNFPLGANLRIRFDIL
jgi:hypothetical protein